MEALAVTPRHFVFPHHHRLFFPPSFPAVHHHHHHHHRSCRLYIKCATSSSLPLVRNSEEFVEASRNGNLIPLYRCIISDHLTPVLAYRCLVKEDDREAPSFLYEAVEPGVLNSHVGRYSIVGAQPSMEIVAKENLVTLMDHLQGKRTEEFVENPMSVPRKMMECWKPQLINELPNVFCGEEI